MAISKYKIGREGAFEDTRAVMPYKAVQLIGKLPIPKDGWQQQSCIEVVEDRIWIKHGPMSIVTAAIQGRYPKYDDVIPKDGDKVATINRGDLLKALRLLEPVTNYQDVISIRCNSSTEMTIAANKHKVENAKVAIALISYTGNPIYIKFKAQQLMSMLRAIEAPIIELHMTTPDRPAMFRFTDNSYQYIVMPTGD